MTEDNHRTMAQRNGYTVGNFPRPYTGWYVVYTGPDASRRGLRDVGPFGTEDEAWSRAISYAIEYRDGV